MALIRKIWTRVATVNSRKLDGKYPDGQDAPSPSGDVTAPTVPGTPRATDIGVTTATLTCDDSTDAVGVAGYQWKRDSTPLTAGANKQITDTGLAASTTYSYYVRAYDAAGNYSAYSSPALSVTTLASSILAWSSPLDTFIELDIGVAFTMDLAAICTSSLGPGSINFTKVSGNWPGGVAQAGTIISGSSTTVETQTVVIRASDGISTADMTFTFESLYADTTAPGLVTGLSVGVGAGPSTCPLSWTNSTDPSVTGQRQSGLLGTDIWMNEQKIDRVVGGGTTYIVGQTNPAIVLTPGSTNAFSVRNVDNAFNKGQRTTPVSFTQPTASVPGIVTAFTVTAVSSSQIDVSWSAPASGATPTTYVLEEQNGSTWSTVQTALTPRSFSRTGLSAGDTRSYRVTAYASAVAGPTSTPLSATTTSSGTTTLVHSDDMEATTFSIGKTSDANYNTKNWTLSDDFDYSLDDPPNTTASRARYGSRSVYCRLTNTGKVSAYNSTVHVIAPGEYAHRNQFNAKALSVANGGTGLVTSLEIGKHYWIGWSQYLHTDFEVAVAAAGYEILYQMHSYDGDPGESNRRNPPITIQTYVPPGGTHRTNFMFQYRCYAGQFGPSSFTTPATYTDRTVTVDLGSYAADLGHWTDWVLHLKPDYNAVGSGITELYKNGVLLVSDIGGGNCYNDSYALSGPNFGWYLGTVAAAAAAVAPARREIWIDEYRFIQRTGDPQAASTTSSPGYLAVAPRGVRT